MSQQFTLTNDQALESAIKVMQARLKAYEESELDKSKRYEVVIRKAGSSESNEQRGAFYMLAKMFGDEIGHTSAEVEQLVKERLYGTTEVELMGHKVTVINMPDDNNRKQRFSEQINTLYQMASEVGIYLPELRR